jgi:GxxExxY protein
MDGTSGHRSAPIRPIELKQPRKTVLIEEALTRSAIGAFYTSYNKLGYGFSEQVCLGALCIELRKRGYRVEREVPIPVYYEGELIGTYRADLVVDGRLLIEGKAERELSAIHVGQLRNYLACTAFEVGLALCYGLKPEFKRLIHTRELKTAVVNRWPLQSDPGDPC